MSRSVVAQLWALLCLSITRPGVAGNGGISFSSATPLLYQWHLFSERADIKLSKLPPVVQDFTRCAGTAETTSFDIVSFGQGSSKSAKGTNTAASNGPRVRTHSRRGQHRQTFAMTKFRTSGTAGDDDPPEGNRPSDYKRSSSHYNPIESKGDLVQNIPDFKLDILSVNPKQESLNMPMLGCEQSPPVDSRHNHANRSAQSGCQPTLMPVSHRLPSTSISSVRGIDELAQRLEKIQARLETFMREQGRELNELHSGINALALDCRLATQNAEIQTKNEDKPLIIMSEYACIQRQHLSPSLSETSPVEPFPSDDRGQSMEIEILQSTLPSASSRHGLAQSLINEQPEFVEHVVLEDRYEGVTVVDGIPMIEQSQGSISGPLTPDSVSIQGAVGVLSNEHNTFETPPPELQQLKKSSLQLSIEKLNRIDLNTINVGVLAKELSRLTEVIDENLKPLIKQWQRKLVGSRSFQRKKGASKYV